MPLAPLLARRALGSTANEPGLRRPRAGCRQSAGIAVTNSSRPRQPSPPGDGPWELCRYITDETPGAMRALTNLRRICEEELAGRYHIEIVDLREHPEFARSADIVAVPTVIRTLPLPCGGSSVTSPIDRRC